MYSFPNNLDAFEAIKNQNKNKPNEQSVGRRDGIKNVITLSCTIYIKKKSIFTDV